jgi:hypothetical protein
VLALKVDEFSVSLNKYSSLRVKFGGSYGFSIQVTVTSYSLVDRYQNFVFFCFINLRVKDFNSDNVSRYFFERMVQIYENIRKQFTVRRYISENGNLSKLRKSCGSGSSVGIATGYGPDDLGIESRGVGLRFSAPVQTGPGAQPASCTMGTGSFSGIKSGQCVTLTPHPLLVPWSRKGRAIPLLPL